MTIECEQFIYGMFNGVGYRLIKSEGVDKWIDEKDLQYLLRLDCSTQTLLPNGIIAITQMSRTIDEYQRGSPWNHTILLWAWDYFDLHPPDLFKPHFIGPLKTPPKHLHALHLEEPTA